MLVKTAHYKVPTCIDWEESVQESLILAYSYIQEGRVKNPGQFLNLTRTFLANYQIDRIRHHRAKKRGSGMVTSLESVIEQSQPQMRKNFRSTEQNALHAVATDALAHSFQTLLKTHNQKRVAAMYFLGYLKPCEIAQAMGKTPHQIRQTVFRVKKEIKQFPPEATKWLPTGD